MLVIRATISDELVVVPVKQELRALSLPLDCLSFKDDVPFDIDFARGVCWLEDEILVISDMDKVASVV